MDRFHRWTKDELIAVAIISYRNSSTPESKAMIETTIYHGVAESCVDFLDFRMASDQ